MYKIDKIINTILQGNALEILRHIPDNSINMVITSPPYWGLRCYNTESQIWDENINCNHKWIKEKNGSEFCNKCGAWKGELGAEPTFDLYIRHLIQIFDEVKRVLKDDGTCWVNLGDAYGGSGAGTSKNADVQRYIENSKQVYILPNGSAVSSSLRGTKFDKSLLQIPSRFAIAMCDRGWILRNEIIWHKPNAMPSSAKDRFTVDYEKLFFFTKNKKYYFEQQFEPIAESTKIRMRHSRYRKTSKEISGQYAMSSTGYCKYKDIEQEKSVRQGMSKDRGNNLIAKRPKLPTQEEFVEFLKQRIDVEKICANTDIKRTTAEHWFRRDKSGFSYPSIEDWNKIKNLLNDESDKFKEMDYKLTYVIYETDDINKNLYKGRNKRCVWNIPTRPFKGAHFAVFPEELVEIPIKAGCPEGGIVMDIFMGSGTTGVVAKRLERNYIGIELNPEYIKIANERIENT